MEAAFLLFLVGVAGAILGRHTPMPPLRAGAMLGVIPGLLAGALMAGFIDTFRAVLTTGVLAYLLAGASGCAGAYLGRFRRERVRRS